MSNISEAIAAVRDADTIISSSILTNDEKGQLIASLKGSVAPALNRQYLVILSNALERLYGSYRPAPPPARPTSGEQDAAPVDTGPGEAPAEAPEGPTTGGEEQAQDAGSLPIGSDGDNGTPAEASAPTQGPKQGKARKQQPA